MTDEKNTSTTTKEQTKCATPSISLNLLVRVLQVLDSQGKPSTRRNLATLVGIAGENVTRAFRYAESLGLVQQTGKKSAYDLTEIGRNFVQFQEERTEEARELIANQILQSLQWEETVRFLKANMGIVRDSMDLVNHLEAQCKKKMSASLRQKVASSLKTILHYAGLANIEGGKLISTVSSETIEASSREEVVDIKEAPSSSLTSSKEDNMDQSRVGRPDDFAELSIPEYFLVFVKKTVDAFDFLRQQFKSDSMLNSWLDKLERELN